MKLFGLIFGLLGFDHKTAQKNSYHDKQQSWQWLDYEES